MSTGPLSTLAGFYSVPLSRSQRLRMYCSWAYIRQTRFLLPLTEWWLNHG